jgi:hypothetical protein
MNKGPALMLDVTLRLDRHQASQLDAIVAALRNCGLQDVRAHTRFMIVSGRAPADQLDALRAVTGVESVREDTRYKAQPD